MSALRAVTAAKFLRRTTLRDTEANTNFRMLDDDVAEAITSAAADDVTPLMSKVYTRLLLTPAEWREGGRVLRFAGQEREGKWVTAWEQLRCHLRVSSETANKALRWMHCQGIIGYYSGKNGVGIRIFLNRAASSVAEKREVRTQKILSLAPASTSPSRTSPAETPFNDSFADSEVLDLDINPHAPKDGAEPPTLFAPLFKQSLESNERAPRVTGRSAGCASHTPPHVEVPIERIVSRLRCELEPTLQRLAQQAAAGEHERTREWLESRGLPKAARVAQRETYDVLRRQGLLKDASKNSHAEVGRGCLVPSPPRSLPEAEVLELAEACVTLFEAKGQPVELTLSKLSVASGGFLAPEDAGRILGQVEILLGNFRCQKGREGG
jgi:hypothetical protein